MYLDESKTQTERKQTLMHKKTAKQILWTVKMSNQNPSIVCIFILELIILPNTCHEHETAKQNRVKYTYNHTFLTRTQSVTHLH